MDISDKEITFNDKGFCNYCTNFLEFTINQMYQETSSDNQLAEIAAKIKASGKNQKYDCVML